MGVLAGLDLVLLTLMLMVAVVQTNLARPRWVEVSTPLIQRRSE